MLREGTVLARKIIDYYAGRGVECSVVDEHSAMLVMLCADGETREFRYGRRAFSGNCNWRKVYRDLEREFEALRMAAGRGREN